jgi:hypothetical protein
MTTTKKVKPGNDLGAGLPDQVAYEKVSQQKKLFP